MTDMISHALVTPACRVRHIHKVKISCDVCGYTERHEASGPAELEDILVQRKWMRYDPSGTDLCAQCGGARPRCTIQVVGLPELQA